MKVALNISDKKPDSMQKLICFSPPPPFVVLVNRITHEIHAVISHVSKLFFDHMLFTPLAFRNKKLHCYVIRVQFFE